MKLYKHFPSEILSLWLVDWQVFQMRKRNLRLYHLPLEVQDSVDYVLGSMQHIIDGDNAPGIFDSLEILRNVKADEAGGDLLVLQFCFDLERSAFAILQEYAKWFNLHYPKMQFLIDGNSEFLRWQETSDVEIYEALGNSPIMEMHTLPKILRHLKWLGFRYKLTSEKLIVKIPKRYSEAVDSGCHIQWSQFKNLKRFTLFERIRLKLGF